MTPTTSMRDLMPMEFLAAECVRLRGDSEATFATFCALVDLKRVDPELFDGSRSVAALLALLPA